MFSVRALQNGRGICQAGNPHYSLISTRQVLPHLPSLQWSADKARVRLPDWEHTFFLGCRPAPIGAIGEARARRERPLPTSTMESALQRVARVFERQWRGRFSVGFVAGVVVSLGSVSYTHLTLPTTPYV